MEISLKKTTRKLVGVIDIDFKLVNKTGLIIRSPITRITIGGKDTETMITRIKYKIEIESNTEELELTVPFIPGSSLKGRMRSLLELYEGAELYSDGKIYMHKRDPTNKNACHDPDHHLDNLFGSPSFQPQKLEEIANKSKSKNEKDVIIDKETAKEFIRKIAPTRLIVEDVYPSREYIEELVKTKKFVSKEDFLEEKPENRIDRITSAADPRFILRVKPGIEFEGAFHILLFDIDEGKLSEYLDLLFRGMMLVEDTYLGGSGTRGYGKIVFKNITILLKNRKYYEEGADPIEIFSLDRPIDYFKHKDEILGKISHYIGWSSESVK